MAKKIINAYISRVVINEKGVLLETDLGPENIFITREELLQILLNLNKPTSRLPDPDGLPTILPC